MWTLKDDEWNNEAKRFTLTCKQRTWEVWHVNHCTMEGQQNFFPISISLYYIWPWLESWQLNWYRANDREWLSLLMSNYVENGKETVAMDYTPDDQCLSGIKSMDFWCNYEEAQFKSFLIQTDKGQEKQHQNQPQLWDHPMLLPTRFILKFMQNYHHQLPITTHSHFCNQHCNCTDSISSDVHHWNIHCISYAHKQFTIISLF